MYIIPVEVEASDTESNLGGSNSSEDIITGDPVIIGLNPNMAFKFVIIPSFKILSFYEFIEFFMPYGSEVLVIIVHFIIYYIKWRT